MKLRAQPARPRRINNATRSHHSPKEKVRKLRLHLLEAKPIYSICGAERCQRKLRQEIFPIGNRILAGRDRSVEAIRGKLNPSIAQAELFTVPRELR